MKALLQDTDIQFGLAGGLNTLLVSAPNHAVAVNHPPIRIIYSLYTINPTRLRAGADGRRYIGRCASQRSAMPAAPLRGQPRRHCIVA